MKRENWISFWDGRALVEVSKRKGISWRMSWEILEIKCNTSVFIVFIFYQTSFSLGIRDACDFFANNWNGNIKTMCEIYSKLTITTPARHYLVFPLLALSKQMLAWKKFLHWEIVNLRILRNFWSCFCKKIY